MNKYVAFLRGINVGGHHKVPMAEFRDELEKLKCNNVVTLLNSGNAIFDAKEDDIDTLEKKISGHLESAFGFPIPTILRKADMISELHDRDPFHDIELTKEIRLYVSFLQNDPEIELDLPWISDDGSFKIIDVRDKAILSILDLSVSKTPKAMEAVQKFFGKDITTRNWNTIKRVEKKLEASR